MSMAKNTGAQENYNMLLNIQSGGILSQSLMQEKMMKATKILVFSLKVRYPLSATIKHFMPVLVCPIIYSLAV